MKNEDEFELKESSWAIAARIQEKFNTPYLMKLQEMANLPMFQKIADMYAPRLVRKPVEKEATAECKPVEAVPPQPQAAEPVAVAPNKLTKTESAQAAASTHNLIPVNVPASLWSGKRPEDIFEALSDKNFAPEIIAYILMEKVKGNARKKTAFGRMFYWLEDDSGNEHEPSTYRRKIDGLLASCQQKYTLTFDD